MHRRTVVLMLAVLLAAPAHSDRTSADCLAAQRSEKSMQEGISGSKWDPFNCNMEPEHYRSRCWRDERKRAARMESQIRQLEDWVSDPSHREHVKVVNRDRKCGTNLLTWTQRSVPALKRSLASIRAALPEEGH